MKSKILTFSFVAVLCMQRALFSHCQMPCGIYHDEMVYDQIDQYVETMYKGMTIITEDRFNTSKDKNEFVRWVILKENSSNELANLLTTYFLQQKIKPDEEDTNKRLISAHKLLFLLMQIKQNTNRKFVDQFADEWDKFKLMFHVEGYECQIEILKKRKREQLEKEAKNLNEHGVHDHDHDHDHDHGHQTKAKTIVN